MIRIEETVIVGVAQQAGCKQMGLGWQGWQFLVLRKFRLDGPNASHLAHPRKQWQRFRRAFDCRRRYFRLCRLRSEPIEAVLHVVDLKLKGKADGDTPLHKNSSGSKSP